jgi:nitrate/nitrite transporter NarK
MGTTFVQAILRLVKILKKPVVVLVLVYYLCIFAWLVAINATLPIVLTELYGFGSKEIGLVSPLRFFPRVSKTPRSAI